MEVGEDIEEKSELELFQEFYRMQNNREMSLEQIAFVERVIEGVRE